MCRWLYAVCNSVSAENVIRPVCHVCVNFDFNNNNSTVISLNMAQAPAPKPIQGIRAPHVLNVEGNVQENWKIFKQKWNNYVVITNLEAQTRQYKTALLLHTLCDEALRIYNGFQFATPEDDRTIVQIIEKFDDFAIGEINVSYEQFVFNKRNQQTNKTFK